MERVDAEYLGHAIRPLSQVAWKVTGSIASPQRFDGATAWYTCKVPQQIFDLVPLK